MNSKYQNPNLRQLRDQQVRFTPRDKKLVQINKAETLLAEIDRSKNYPVDFITFRITGYRPEGAENDPPMVSGADVQHDLQLFIEDLSDAADIRVEDVPEVVSTVDQLGKKFNVSTKTISRWRKKGLVSRRFIFNGRKRVGFLQSSVDRFVAKNRDVVERGARFSQLTDVEREEIIYRARRYARAGACPSDVTRRIAERMKRSVETIRYSLKEYDRNNKELAIFPHHGAPLTDQVKQEIFNLHARGMTAESIARKYCRTPGSVYRILSQMRARRIEELPLDYMPSEEFLMADADARILGPMPQADKPFRKVKVPEGLPSYLASLYEVPLLTREQEQHVFRKMNYLKFKASRLRDTLDCARPKVDTMDAIDQLYAQVVEVKNQIVQANLRLVVSIAKRHVAPGENFFHLVSDGNISLMRAGEKFDYTRGNKFSTYASWAIMKNFARTIPNEFRQRDRFRTSHDETFAASQDERANPFALESAQQIRKQQIGRILSRLDEREQKIIISRFGLDHRVEPQTLKEVGAELGVTKERIRQIEARALTKLRAAAREEKIELV